MITNPGFNFSLLSGTHKIVPTKETDLPIWGEQYNEAVVFQPDNKIKKIYANGPGYNYSNDSIALTFASLDINDKESILKFCDKYGMPYSHASFGNFRNDYIFYNLDKSEFMKHSPLLNKNDRTWLFTIQRDIIEMQKCIKLHQAISDRDIISIINILIYFCFNLYGLDFEDTDSDFTHVKTETFQFNHYFFKFTENSYHKKETQNITLRLTELIQEFLEGLEWDYTITTSAATYGIHIPSKYNQINFSLWQNIHTIFTGLLEHTSIDKMDEFGELTYNKPIGDIVFSDYDIDILLKVAKCVFSDIFKERLHQVFPEITFNENGNAESSWSISSLLDAMYLELFFLFTPNSQARKCENPDCTQYYIRSSRRPTKKYCSDSCAKLMAKRKQRKRERENKDL